MDELEALEECKRLWLFLADNPEKSKIEAFLEIWPEREPLLHDCPACEYTTKFSKTRIQNCRYCPIDEWRRRDRPLDSVRCENTTSPFYDWCTDRNKAQAAIKIVELVEESIQRRLAENG